MTENNDNELKNSIKKEYEADFEDKLQRLKFLNKLNYDSISFFTSPVPAYWYYEEAVNCYYDGNFIATIILSQVALEERLRVFFRVSNHVKFNTGKKHHLNDAVFADLIDEANSIKLIDSTERDLLHYLRKDIRNLYTHSKDKDLKTKIKMHETIKEISVPHFVLMDMKIKKNIEPNTKTEAEKALRILVKIYNAICNRSPMA